MNTHHKNELGLEVRHILSLARNYFIVAFRNLKKNKVSSIINVVGLSISISVALVTFLFVQTVFTQDTFHEQADSIFLIHQIRQTDDGQQWVGETPYPLGPLVAASSTDIELVARIVESRASVAMGDLNQNASLRFVDSAFLEMFSFPLASGSASILEQPNGLVLSQQTATRFFGERDPVGEVLRIRVGDGEPREWVVGAVAESFPANANIQFSMLAGMAAHNSLKGLQEDDWSISAAATFLLLSDPAALPQIENLLTEEADRVNVLDPEWQIAGFALDNLTNLAFNRDQVENTISGGISMAPVFVLSLVSGLLLLLSCFNYMNISMTTATKRLKEIGVRKVVGGSRKQIVLQFLIENVELCTAALLLGVGIAWQFLLPAFNNLASVNIQFGFLDQWGIWVFLIGIVLATGLISGAYPALFISGFRPTIIFQGKERLKRSRPMTYSFLTFQFLVAFLTMSSGIVLSMNGRYHAQMDWGYEGENVLVFQTDDPGEMDIIRSQADALTSVTEAAYSREVIGGSTRRFESTFGLNTVTGNLLGTSRSYVSMMGIELETGIMPDDVDGMMGSESVLVNNQFVVQAGLSEPIGTVFRVDSTDYSIAGVVKDFHYADFFSVIQPLVFTLVPPADFTHVSLKLLPGTAVVTAESINQALEEANPDQSASYYFQDENFQAFFEESGGIASIFVLVATISLIISCLSIYALSSQNVLNRMKEIGVRKVLGGQSAGIARLVNRKLLIIMTVASVLAAPLAFLGLDALLDNIFAYRMTLNFWPFLITYAIILGTTLLTISTQIGQINRAQPADILRID